MPEQRFDPASLKREEREAWNKSAASWNKWWPILENASQAVNARLVELAGVKPGHRVLDIATGTGEPAVTAARAVGPGGRVVGVDQSGEMLAIARERARALGLTNLEFVESDAESARLDDASFDAAVCRWGLMFMPDLDGAVRLIHRALKPGARFATAVWASGEKVPMITLASEAIRRIAKLPPPPPGAIEPTRLADTSILSAALSGAGFSQLGIETMIVPFHFRSPDEFADFRSELGRAGAMMARLTTQARAEVRAELIRATDRFKVADGSVVLPSETICFCARA
jgi:ubiquinone/menaquinone biosynthesis C-methylase UbiE